MSDKYFVAKGAHSTREDGMCSMEMTAYLAGEKHSDSPQCVSPVLTSFCIRLNDRLDDTDRQKLRPYLARTIGTRGDGKDDERIQLCREFLLRQALPLYLDAAGRDQAAAYLRSLPAPLTVEATLEAIQFARGEAFDARRQAEARLADRIRAELAKHGWSAAAAVGAADVAAAVVAAAVVVGAADVAAAVVAAAAAVVAADVVAVAAAVVAAVAAAADVVAAAAAADVAAADVVAAAAAAVPSLALRNELRRLLWDKAIERARAFNQELTPAAFELLDRMLPTEVIQLPVVEDAELVCRAPELEVIER